MTRSPLSSNRKEFRFWLSIFSTTCERVAVLARNDEAAVSPIGVLRLTFAPLFGTVTTYLPMVITTSLPRVARSMRSGIDVLFSRRGIALFNTKRPMSAVAAWTCARIAASSCTLLPT